MTQQPSWFNRVQQIDLPAVLPLAALPDASASLEHWQAIIREDPLLTIHLFRYANKMLASHEVSVHTLEHAVNLLGNTRLVALSNKIPRIPEHSSYTKGLLRAIGDSLLAASLMRQWFEIRQIPWTEADYWVTLFYDLGIWLGWLLEPEKMEAIEFQVRQGQDRNTLMKELIGLPLRDWNDKLCRYFQLPILPDESSQAANRIAPFKRSALTFFLPFSHDLAFAVRQDWTSDALDQLCRTGEISLGLTEFKPLLKQWVAVAGREYLLPHAGLAARRLLAQQPAMQAETSNSGFSDSDLALVNKLTKITEIEHKPAAELNSWPEADAAIAMLEQQIKDTSEPAAEPPTITTIAERDGINLNTLTEIRRQFRNQKTWHSPVEIQESAIYGLVNGLKLSRVVAMELSNGFWQTFEHEGCQEFPLLRNLKLAARSSAIVEQLTSRETALWVNTSNKNKAYKLLPPPLLAACENESFFIRSFAIANQVTMLLYADCHGQEAPMTATDYQHFREYCADWNTALNKIRT